MKVIYHLGLGDAIVCAPIIVKLSQWNDIVEIPCWEHNLVSVKSFYVNYPNVVVCSFKTEAEVLLWSDGADLRLGYYNKELPQLPNEDFVEWFYRQAQLDISFRKEYCPIQKASENFNNHNAKYSDFIFIHDDKSRGFVIDKLGFRPYNEPGESILSKVKTISNAKEIHCIDSSFLHLIESIETKGNLFYHHYARPQSTVYKSLKNNWTTIY